MLLKKNTVERKKAKKDGSLKLFNIKLFKNKMLKRVLADLIFMNIKYPYNER